MNTKSNKDNQDCTQKKGCRIVIYESREYSCVNKRVLDMYFLLQLSKYRRIHSFTGFLPFLVQYLAFFKANTTTATMIKERKKVQPIGFFFVLNNTGCPNKFGIG